MSTQAVVSTEVLDKWMAEMSDLLREVPDPVSAANRADQGLEDSGRLAQRIGLWFALAERRGHQNDGLRGVERIIRGMNDIDSKTGKTILSRLGAGDQWNVDDGLEAALAVVRRVIERNDELVHDGVGFAMRALVRAPQSRGAFRIIARVDRLDRGVLQRIAAELGGVDRRARSMVLNIVEEKLAGSGPDAFVSYVEALMAWWDGYDGDLRDELTSRLTPILNTEILHDFSKISAVAFERSTNAIANAGRMDEDRRRALIRELVPHSRDLAQRQPIAPPLAAQLRDEADGVIDRVMENADGLDPLAAAGFLLNVIDLLKTSSLRFDFAKRVIAAYGGWDIVRRAATIDILGREMWRFLGYAEPSPYEVEGLAEASEPFINVMEIELVEQLRSEIDALRLLSFPRV